jgi:hypothetical protein
MRSIHTEFQLPLNSPKQSSIVYEQSPDAKTEEQVPDPGVNHFTSFADLKSIIKENSHKDIATDNVLDEEMKTMSKHDSSEIRSFKPFDTL